MPWRCIWWVGTNKVVAVYLRRYAPGSSCPGAMSYHNAVARIDDRPGRYYLTPEGYLRSPKRLPPRKDPRWPTRCSCGYEFAPSDKWQITTDWLLYQPGAEGVLVPMRALPPGAMFDADWLHYRGDPWVGADGIALSVVLPPAVNVEYTMPHIWHADGPSSSGGKWQRQGDPRLPGTLTITPSILTGQYHGFLQAGMLTDSLGDRPLPPGPD